MLFSAVLIYIPNLKVCLKRKSSIIAHTALPAATYRTKIHGVFVISFIQCRMLIHIITRKASGLRSADQIMELIFCSQPFHVPRFLPPPGNRHQTHKTELPPPESVRSEATVVTTLLNVLIQWIIHKTWGFRKI